MALSAVFDLLTPVALYDEAGYRWTIAHLAAGHGLRFFPSIDPLALPELVLGALVAQLHPAPYLLRLIQVPALVFDAILVTALCLRAGSSRFWAATGAAILVCCPVLLSLATGMMTEPIFLALLLGAAWCGWDWVDHGRHRVPCVVLLLLAMSQRQILVTAPLALALALIARGPGRRPTASDWALIAATALGVAAILMAPFALRLAGPGMQSVAGDLQRLWPAYAMGTIVVTPVMLGLYCLPLMAALMLTAPGTVRRGAEGRLTLLPVGMAVAALAGFAVFTLRFGTMIYPGEWYGAAGLGQWTTMGGPKPLLFAPGFLAVEALTAVSWMILLVRHRLLWVRGWLSPPRVLRAVLLLSSITVMLAHSATDRYFLPVLALLLPDITALLTRAEAELTRRRAVAGRAWAVALLGVWLAIFAIGEQDYQAWQNARFTASRLAYGQAPAEEVSAGVESYQEFVLGPFLDRHGRPPRGGELGAGQQTLRLVFAAADDPRPGVPYHSLAPGKIVIEVIPARGGG